LLIKSKKLLRRNDFPLHGIQEVSGSIPLISTKLRKKHLKSQDFGCFF